MNKSDKHHDGRFWRTLDELGNDAAFQERLHQEFPSEVEAIADPVARRTFLKLMGASIALAGVTACTKQPKETIVPYVKQPEDLVPGKPLFFATSMALGGVATGLLAESHEGRPTKLEGNSLHPTSLGGADVFAQAAILNLYDPDRVRILTFLGEEKPWTEFVGTVRAAAMAQLPLKGAGIRLLTEAVNSPTLAAQIAEFLARFPEARWHQWDPASPNAAYMGAKQAFGDVVDTQYRLAEAHVVVSLDSDFLASGLRAIRYARDFAARRKPSLGEKVTRLYAAESMPTATGARADHRLPVRASDIEMLATALAAAVGVPGVAAPAGKAPAAAEKWAHAVVADLMAHKGESLVIAGEHQPAAVHALVCAINDALGNVGKTVVYTEPVQASPVDQLASLRELVGDMSTGKVDLLIVLGGNPVFTAPPDVKVADAMKKVDTRVHLSEHNNETSALCQWLVPQAHFLEAWSDARAHDGTASIVQPLIAPLYKGHSSHEVLGALSEKPAASGYEIVRDYWKTNGKAGAEFEVQWRRWLHDGIIPGTAFAARAVTLKAEATKPSVRPAGSGLEVIFRNDPTVLDGRFANNGWLQELPKPITRLTWDNAVLMSPATAAKLGIDITRGQSAGEHGHMISNVVEVKLNGKSVKGAAWTVPGHPDESITLHLGYGRERGGSVQDKAGFNANVIRTAATANFALGAEVTRTRETYPLACVQAHHLMEGRHLVRAVPLEEYLENPKSMLEGDETPAKTLTMYQEFPYEGYKWGMSIDVNACVGCNACVVSCVAENNIPVVGKDQVMRGREMHWIRIDTYYRGEMGNPETYFQPVPCMQCENAPCEVVCPVGATAHSHEGLNDMVYNRCVGTRYCSNNCPYKVRRFNFLLYQDWDTPSLKLGRNPDVTVRSRGVMEKCTYCVQRINAAKIEAEKENRKVRDGEIQTACQATCPAEAIVFGDLNDPKSRVVQLKAEQRNYSLLGELNTRPRTTYLGAIRNVNRELGE